MENIIKNGKGETLSFHETKHKKEEETLESVATSLAESVSRSKNARIDVKADYGAKGDGVLRTISSVNASISLASVQALNSNATLSDSWDWYCIQKAINENKGTTIFIPSGNYHISKPLDVDDGTILEGSGSKGWYGGVINGTKITLANGSNCSLYRTKQAKTGNVNDYTFAIGILNINFDGNRTNQTLYNPLVMVHGAYITSFMHNVHIENGRGTGLHMKNNDITIDEVWVSNLNTDVNDINNKYGVYMHDNALTNINRIFIEHISTDSTNIDTDYNFAGDNRGYGLRIGRSHNTTIKEVHFEGVHQGVIIEDNNTSLTFGKVSCSHMGSPAKVSAGESPANVWIKDGTTPNIKIDTFSMYNPIPTVGTTSYQIYFLNKDSSLTSNKNIIPIGNFANASQNNTYTASAWSYLDTSSSKVKSFIQNSKYVPDNHLNIDDAVGTNGMLIGRTTTNSTVPVPVGTDFAVKTERIGQYEMQTVRVNNTTIEYQRRRNSGDSTWGRWVQINKSLPVIKYTVNSTTVPANGAVDISVTATGLYTSDDMVVVTPTGVPDINLRWFASTASNNTINLRLANVSASPITINGLIVKLMVIKLYAD